MLFLNKAFFPLALDGYEINYTSQRATVVGYPMIIFDPTRMQRAFVEPSLNIYSLRTEKWGKKVFFFFFFFNASFKKGFFSELKTSPSSGTRTFPS